MSDGDSSFELVFIYINTALVLTFIAAIVFLLIKLASKTEFYLILTLSFLLITNICKQHPI